MAPGMILRSIGLGAGLAMDAFSVSLANGLNDPRMSTARMCGIASVYAFFQFGMPLIGWICVVNVARTFRAFEKLIPWIALILLLYIGGKMLISGIGSRAQRRNEPAETPRGGDATDASAETPRSADAPSGPAGDSRGAVTFGTLIVQGVATSIDALSVGFAFAEYDGKTALTCAIIIAAVTFIICFCGLAIGRKIGTRISGGAEILGGVILILIGIEIFVKGVFF